MSAYHFENIPLDDDTLAWLADAASDPERDARGLALLAALQHARAEEDEELAAREQAQDTWPCECCGEGCYLSCACIFEESDVPTGVCVNGAAERRSETVCTTHTIASEAAWAASTKQRERFGALVREAFAGTENHHNHNQAIKGGSNE